MTKRPDFLDCIDQLNQIRDELRVVWCALTNPHHAEENVAPIGEHVNGIQMRLTAICSQMQGATP